MVRQAMSTSAGTTVGRSLLTRAASVIRVTVFSMSVTGYRSSCLFQRTRLDSRTKEWGEDSKGDGWVKFTYPRSSTRPTKRICPHTACQIAIPV